MKRIWTPGHFYGPTLMSELFAAIPALASVTGSDGLPVATWTMHVDDTGVTLDVPDATNEQAIATVMAAHDPTPPPPPVVFSDAVPISGRLRTTNATPTEVYRLTVPLTTGYAGEATIIGVDAGNGALRVIRASFAVKRLLAGAVAVGAPVVIASHGDAAAAAWTITPSVSGNDVILSVAGAAGRNIDWLISGSMIRFAPGGLP